MVEDAKRFFDDEKPKVEQMMLFYPAPMSLLDLRKEMGSIRRSVWAKNIDYSAEEVTKAKPRELMTVQELNESDAPVPKREDFKSRLDYATACYKAGVLPEARSKFK